jgi:hypothetical protein
LLVEFYLNGGSVSDAQKRLCFMSDSSGLKATAWGLFVFLVFALPIGVFSIWGSFEKDKTIPQWLAERGWPSVSQIAVPYVIGAAVVSFLFYLALTAHSKRRERPKLYGEIICIEDDVRLDRVDGDYDCFITLCVEVRNSATPTSIPTFSLDLWLGEQDHPGTHEPLDGYYVQTWGREPGDERSKHKIRTNPLKDFPCGEEITDTNYKNGWLRFSFGSLPPEMVRGGDHLAKEVIVHLVALDNQRKPHTIYKGTLFKGPVERMAGCGKIVRRELKLY